MKKLTFKFGMICLMMSTISTNVYADFVQEDMQETFTFTHDTTKTTDEHTLPKNVSLTNDVLFSIGFNLNLIDKNEETSGLYYDINTYMPKLHENSKFGRVMGLEMRFNQGTFIPKGYPEDSGHVFFKTNEPVGEEIIDVLRQDYVTTHQSVESYLSLSASPIFNIGDDDNVFPIHPALHFEFLRKTTDFITDNVLSSENNFQIGTDEENRYTFVGRKMIAGRHVATSHEHIFNLGGGIKLYKELNNVTINLKLIFGMDFNPDRMLRNTEGDRFDARKQAFYLTHFEVIERSLGFKIGGEVRGLFANDYDSLRPSARRAYQPFSNIYIAKVFKFSKLYEILSL